MAEKEDELTELPSGSLVRSSNRVTRVSFALSFSDIRIMVSEPGHDRSSPQSRSMWRRLRWQVRISASILSVDAGVMKKSAERSSADASSRNQSMSTRVSAPLNVSSSSRGSTLSSSCL